MVEDSATKGGYGGDSAASSAGAVAPAKPASRGVDLITGPQGELVGFSVSQAAQLYTTIDRIINSQRILALPVADRFALAGKVAAAPEEHARLVEKLASTVATSISEAGALNALYVLDVSKELVPGFREKIPEGRLEKAAELSPHPRAQAAVLKGEKPREWARADQANPSQVILLPQEEEEEESDLLTETGRAVGDATKFVGSAAFGGVGLVTDTLGITEGAEEELGNTAEDAVDLLGDGVHTVVSTLDHGLDGTADDLHRKGVVGAVGDGMADAVDMVSDFARDAVMGVAGGVQGLLDFVADSDQKPQAPESHMVAIVVAELFGEERSLGLRIENRVITNFTKQEAAKLGWRLGDCIVGVNTQQATSQEVMLAGIAQAKEALKQSGTPIRFLVERLGRKP